MAEEEGFEEATPEEKLRIAQHYLLSSPPGQINDVLADVRKLVDGDLLAASNVNDIYRAYNIENFKIADAGDHKVLISKHGEVDGTHYIDPIANTVIGFNHVKQEIVSGESRPVAQEMDAALEPQRAAVQKAMSSYVSSQFGTQSVGSAVYAKNGQLIVCVSAERLNLRNFWSGKWRSEFSVTMSESTGKVEGSALIHIHYFEDGNVQMKNSKTMSQSINFTDPASLGSAVIDAIKQFEDVIQKSLEEMYSNMSSETFKEMRRVMPITRTKMDWNVNAHKMVRNLHQKN